TKDLFRIAISFLVRDPAVTGPFKTMWSESNRHSFLSDYLAHHHRVALQSSTCIHPRRSLETMSLGRL
ncbi:hypothetical protein BDW62DRAFT_193341, partial [Aspergillus aurantiobrunneus]